MDATEAQAVDNLLRWLFRRAGRDGAPVSDERFCEAPSCWSARPVGRSAPQA